MWGEEDPSFLIPGLEVYQNPPRVDRTPRLEINSPERSTERKAIAYDDDVLDVEFKDNPSPSSSTDSLTLASGARPDGGTSFEHLDLK
jgi:hypothetical protein